ncbi:uncharacterized protein KGF55_002678 [Candida pseudojiufengensis]|uniref:uncharacterized protein n=1 Tax=Candida pseudojiufengensis TaxID=497109 RepID=UPI002224E7AB|nr:uncharacterized protein KGF55_002678 [Candida pseudojiufengensis]KAI5963798.1 hypothetical protein KGF55_002678 [Candida pseudojiufengensis]
MKGIYLQKLSRHRIKVLVIAVLTLILFGSLINTNINSYNINDIHDEETLATNPQLSEFHNHLNDDQNHKPTIPLSSNPGLEKDSKKHKFWNSIFEGFDSNKMDSSDGPLIHYTDKSEHLDDSKTKKALLSRAKISNEVVASLKKKHKRVVEDLPNAIPDYIFKKGSTGVVFIGGAKFSWLTYLAILSLKETGSKLPIEVVMPKKEDYEREREYCDKLLPELGAKCIVVPEELGETTVKGRKLKSFQFKSIALAISSFQNILLLDSDNMLVSNPDLVFKSKLYQKYGMITWPDYWKRTIFPKYYDIADIQVNEGKRVRYDRFPLFEPVNSPGALNVEETDEIPYHDLENAIPDLSTESGQLMINKATHGKTILLSLYYNIYGPDIFYKLFSLGEQGEGDKDTFVTAAIVNQQPYYQVKSFILSPGYFKADGGFQGVAMAQKNPLVDEKLFNELVVDAFDKSGRTLSIPDQITKLKALAEKEFNSHNDVPIFALHCNYPKLDPLNYMVKDDIYDATKKRLKYRLYDKMHYDKTVINNLGEEEIVKTDFEYEQWLHMKDVLCINKYKFEHFKDHDMEEVCTFVNNQVEWLKPES